MVSIVPSYVAKITRAKKHLIDLNEAVDEYADAHPYTVREGIEGKKKTRVWRLALKSSPANTDIPIIAADAIYNLRSSLDHLMSSLVARKDRGSAMFPDLLRGRLGKQHPKGRTSSESRIVCDGRPTSRRSLTRRSQSSRACSRRREVPTIRPPACSQWSTASLTATATKNSPSWPLASPISTSKWTCPTGTQARYVPGEHPHGALQDNAQLHGIPDNAVNVEIAGIALVAIPSPHEGRYIQIPEEAHRNRSVH